MKMKKYLMMGAAALTFGFVAISCSSDNEVYNPNADSKDVIAYNSNFIKKFGQPAADQDWGFGTPANARITRAVYSNLNMLGNVIAGGLNIYAPKNVDDPSVCANETELVVAEFSKYRPEAKNELNINFTDFFVHQVYKGNSKDRNGNYYKDGNGNNVYDASSNMNHLHCFANATFADMPNVYTNQVNQGKAGVGNGFMEHINNFNSGNNTNEVTVDNQSVTSPGYKIKGATLMLNSGTNDFAYHNSTDSKYHNEYIIIAGADIDPRLAGYYYVGFDFYAYGTDVYPANKNMDVNRDWVFNDWIVRISPAQYGNAARVACEDLGTTDDFDFNDVVFDVATNKSDFWDNAGNHNVLNYTIITLQAAGGTLPLYLKVGGVEKEVHELFGVETTTMVNTNNMSVSRPIIQFTVDGTYSPKDVAVIVKQEGAKEITLKAEEGQVPQKICVQTSFQWCDERQQIGDKYENFPKWVQNKQIVWY